MDKDRSIALGVLVRVEREKAFSNLELNHALEREAASSPAFVRELVYGVLRHKFYLDHQLSQLVAKGYGKLDPETLLILRMGAYQISFMDHVPPFAAVNESVELAKKRTKGKAPFVNGVLRNYLRKKDSLRQPEEEAEPEDRLALRYSAVRWIPEVLIRDLGEERAASVLRAENETPDLYIHVNTLKISAEELENRLVQDGFFVQRVPGEPVLIVRGSSLLAGEAFREGLFFVQDLSSWMAVKALAPEPGSTLIDCCSAPGGKSLAAALLMEGKGRILSLDKYASKLKPLRRQAERMGITMISCSGRDALMPVPEEKGKADYVICDVPCSGLGVIRRKPEIKFRDLPDKGEELSELQYRILEASASYLREGGKLLYSTCTMNRTENQNVTSRFLESRPEFRALEERQLYPDADGTDGFYYCVIERKAD